MVFKRMGDMISATVHEGLDQLENPRVMLNQYLRNMEDEVSKAKQNIVKQQSIEHSFQKQKEEARQMTEKRKKQAEVALDAGEEELSRSALAEMKHYEAKNKQYQELQAKAKMQVADLREQLQELQEKFQKLKDKKHALIARANAANAKQHMNVSMNKIDSHSSFKEFERLEDRIHEMEMKADVWGGSAANGTAGSYIQMTYKQAADEELEKLKQAKGSSSNDNALLSSNPGSSDEVSKQPLSSQES